MTIKALVFGGVQITGITPPKCCSQYDGVWVELVGITFKDGHWQRAGMMDACDKWEPEVPF